MRKLVHRQPKQPPRGVSPIWKDPESWILGIEDPASASINVELYRGDCGGAVSHVGTAILYTCFSGICSFITTNLAYQDTPTYPDTLTGPCLSRVWVRGGSGELATGVCPAYRLTASDGSHLKNDTQWKSRAGGVVSMADGGGGSGEMQGTHRMWLFFCADVWIRALTVDLALVTISQTN